MAFRNVGDNASARELLAKAIETNPHAPAFLLGKKKMHQQLPDYVGVGDEREAIAFCADFAESWQRTPGALVWLGENWKKEEVVVAAAKRTGKRLH